MAYIHLHSTCSLLPVIDVWGQLQYLERDGGNLSDSESFPGLGFFEYESK